MALAAGYLDVCWSTDGATWTPISVSETWPDFRGAVANDALGEITAIDTGGNVLHAFYDFASDTFSTAPLAAAAEQGIALAAYDDALGVRHLVSLDYVGRTQESLDEGVTWSAPARHMIGTIGAAFPNGLGAAPGQLFVLGAGEQIQRSTDDTASFQLVRFDSGSDNTGVAWAHGRAVVSQSQVYGGSEFSWSALVSTDGLAFDVVPIQVIPSGIDWAGPSINVVATDAGFGILYPEAQGLRLVESPDGVTWTSTEVPEWAVWGNLTGTGTAMFSGGSYMSSLAQLEVGNPWNPVAVQGNTQDGTLTTWSSTGAGDVPFSQMWGTPGSYYGVVDSTIYFSPSPKGYYWNLSSSLPFGGATCHLGDPGVQYVANAAGQLTSSTDGTTWTSPITIDPRGITRLLRLGDHLIAVGKHGLIAVSADGVSWTAIEAPVWGDLVDAAVTDRGLVMVGPGDVVLTAP
jgi:hypothetical protein